MISRCEQPARCRSGFSLIELLVVLAILGLTLALIVGYRPPWSRGLGLQSAAAELAAGLRLARSEAVLSNRQILFEVDTVTHRYQVGSAKPRSLPADLSMELLTVSGEARKPGEGDIRFNPDGSSTGGRISLIDGRRKIAVGVDWLTGRVSVADVR